MKRIFFILVAIVALSSWGSIMAQENSHESNKEGITFFDGSWDEALATAKKENKLVFLDVYATWCGPCKLLKSKTFPDQKAGKFFNENFINVTLDGEKGDGLKVARQLQVSAYPSLFILNPDGELVLYFAGYLGPDELVKMGKAGIQNNKAN